MSNWALVDENNIVVQVVVGNDSFEDEGYSWLMNNFPGKWIKTSYNTYGGQHMQGKEPLRKNYAGVGFVYDEDIDAFYSPKPFDSWILDPETCHWHPPIPYPQDGNRYVWDEDSMLWNLI